MINIMENVVQTTAETPCTKGMNSLSPYKTLHFGCSTIGQGSFLVVPQYNMSLQKMGIAKPPPP